MLTCPVCQDIFKDPRQLPCGHSLCMSCLEGMIDFSSDMPFRCPDCRAYFGSIVGVQKSYALANVAEDCRENQKAKQNVNVLCDHCQNEELAVKTCLKCEVSLCQEHIKIHYECPAYTGHPLVKPLHDLVNRKCPQHDDEVLRYYCTVSRSYVCNLCAVEKKQVNQAAEASNVLSRKLTAHMDERFQLFEETLKDCANSNKKLKEYILNKVSFNSLHVFLSCHKTCCTYVSVKEIPTLDIDSASPFLQVSPDLQSVTRVQNKLTLPSRDSRFDVAPQVLSHQCFSSGTHRWLVEVEGYWDIAVTYQSIQRKGKDGSAFGTNKLSWSLTQNSKGQLFAYHNRSKKVLTQPLTQNQVVVAVDFESGTITFKEAAPTFTHLCEFQAKLTQPLCLGFGLYRVEPLSRATIVRVY
ncbi:E3 ubiquitin-protein ligase Midline-1 [Aplochiton taeniatus]